ncbi:MAG TPA: hypothetical protein PLL69_01835 [Gemmatimonadales bacterium]|nr:hypothetical protein [Gemmatimonadales bacterium]
MSPGSFVAGAIILVFGLLPIANWIPGGYEAGWYLERMELWVWGGGVVVGVGVLAALAVRRYPGLWLEGGWGRLALGWRERGWNADLVVAAGAFSVYAASAWLVFSAKPLLIDEVISLFQARVFASGHTSLPVPAIPELTSAMHLVDTGSQLYGQFPPGGPAFLAIGSLIGAEWVIGPLAGALSVLIFARLLRLTETSSGTALAALLLFAFSPFVVFMSGTMMNHVTALTWMLAAALALALATRDPEPRLKPSFFVGIALGAVATIRPLDAVTIAIPSAVWLLIRLRLGRAHLYPLLASGAGLILSISPMLIVNAAWTGNPFRFGYEELWGSRVGLGFGPSPWGDPHTPIRGMELVNLYFLRLQTHFLETPLPALLAASLALVLWKRLSSFDRWLLACSGLLVAAYFAYWHDGYYLGPRFMYPLAPALACWTARLPSALREKRVPDAVIRGVIVTGLACCCIAVTQLIPIRARQYRLGMLTMRQSPVDLARSLEIENATILVRETWGSQMIARMWALGVTRPRAEAIYRTTDACQLETAITAVENSQGGGAEFEEMLLPSRSTISNLRALTATPDTTLRALPGSVYSSRCMRRIIEDQAGSTLWAPLLLAQDDNTWIRDLHQRSSRAIRPDRPVWLLTQDVGPGGPLSFRAVDADSMRLEWELD